MGILGSDANKLYKDNLVTGYETVDGKKNPVIDETKESFSSTFFKKAENKNQVKNLADLKLSKVSSTKITVNYLPTNDSPLINGGDTSLPGGAAYIGAFSGPTDNWMEGWTNFDPQNTTY